MLSHNTFGRALLLSGALLLWQGTAEASTPEVEPATPPPTQEQPGTAPPQQFPSGHPVKPGPSDPGGFATLATRNTDHWRLMELQGRPAEYYEHQAIPQLVFMPESATQGRIGGADGCNRLLGGYTLQGDDGITFTHLGSTKMLCPQGDAQARLMLESLEQSTRWYIRDDRLELWGIDKSLAVFMAVPPASQTIPAAASR